MVSTWFRSLWQSPWRKRGLKTGGRVCYFFCICLPCFCPTTCLAAWRRRRFVAAKEQDTVWAMMSTMADTYVCGQKKQQWQASYVPSLAWESSQYVEKSRTNGSFTEERTLFCSICVSAAAPHKDPTNEHLELTRTCNPLPPPAQTFSSAANWITNQRE